MIVNVIETLYTNIDKICIIDELVNYLDIEHLNKDDIINIIKKYMVWFCKSELRKLDTYFDRGGEVLNKKTLIIAHGDLDGIISAYLAALLSMKYSNYTIKYTQPFLIGSLKEYLKHFDNIIIVDIAVNNRDPDYTIDFINALIESGKKWLWIDHHSGWDMIYDKIPYEYINNIVYNMEAVSCAYAVSKYIKTKYLSLWNIINDDKLKYLVFVANLSDSGKLLDDKLDKIDYKELIYMALKSDIKSGKIKALIFNTLFGDIDSMLSVCEYADNYYEVLNNTYKLFESRKRVDNIIIVNATEVQKFDMTKLFTMCYKESDIVIVIWRLHDKGKDLMTIATKRKDIDLVKVLGVESGAAFRVTIDFSKEKLEEVIDKLKNL